MATGKRLLEESMPQNFKQGLLYPTHYLENEYKPYGGSRKRKAGKIRKAGQNKVRKQLKKDMMAELYDDQV